MKSYKIHFFALVLAIVASLGSFSAQNAKDSLIESNFATALAHENYETAYTYMTMYPHLFPESDVEWWLSQYPGLEEYRDELVAIGMLSSSTPKSPTASQDSLATTVTAPASTPISFTVEAYKPGKVMWATQNVNTRDGASTEYGKTGSLKQYEQVNVTGVASTGWYQVTREDGTIVYVSNKYLSEEKIATPTNASNNAPVTATEEPMEIQTDVQSSTESATPASTTNATTEPTIEPTLEPTAVPTDSPTATPALSERVDTSNHANYTLYIIAIAGIVLIVIIIATVLIRRTPKDK